MKDLLLLIVHLASVNDNRQAPRAGWHSCGGRRVGVTQTSIAHRQPAIETVLSQSFCMGEQAQQLRIGLGFTQK
jgi:hypothetical protein